METRKTQEAAFHDHLRAEEPSQRYTQEVEDRTRDNPDWSNFKFYSIERSSRAYTDAWITRHVPGKRVLDYGCGNGDDVIFAVEQGATEAFGIDISAVSIANATKKAADKGLASRAKFVVMDAEKLGFPDDFFDVVIVYGVLHHMEFEAAMGEIARVLKPGGAAICTEALAHNPVIAWYRRRTPELRTDWEVQHILRRKNIRDARRWFGDVKFRTYHLATLAAVPLRHSRLFGPVLRGLGAIDSMLLRIPLLRWWAWHVVFELSNPRSKPTPRTL